MSKPLLSVIIPCYFNQDNIAETIDRLRSVAADIEPVMDLEFVCVDDGSEDQTYTVLKSLQEQYPRQLKVIKLTRNFGSNNAVLAGLKFADGDTNLILAADLQDPPELIPKMTEYWLKGIPLVVANRTDRNDPFLNTIFSGIYHRLMRRFGVRNVPKGGFDMILFDRRIKEDLLRLDEHNTYLPYLLMWMGYDYVNIPYERQKRTVGKSRWTFSKKVKSFIDSFVAFSFFPIRMISITGVCLGLAALIYISVIFYYKFINRIPVEGWSSLMIVILAVSSFQMIALGIMGEYLWRTLDASRKRPNFIVDNVIDDTPERQ